MKRSTIIIIILLVIAAMLLGALVATIYSLRMVRNSAFSAGQAVPIMAVTGTMPQTATSTNRPIVGVQTSTPIKSFSKSINVGATSTKP